MEALELRKELLAVMQAVFSEPRNADEQEAVEEMAEEVQDSVEMWKRMIRGECPLAFFIPSLEQALVLNAWHPSARTEGFQNVNPEKLPDFLDYEGGYRSVGNYTANRGGKTTSMVVNTDLWILPQGEDWAMFQWRDDWMGRGRYRVLPRPDWEMWHRRGRWRYNWLEAPAKGACTIWNCVGRSDDWTAKLFLAYQELMPNQYWGRRDDGYRAIFKLEQRFQTAFGHDVIGMTMSAEADKFAGKAAWMVNIDEGVEQDIFRELMTRVQAGGYFHQAYTPVDPANIGKKAAVAKKIYRRDPGFELVGNSKFFTRFRVADAPPWIIPEEKKADDLRRWKGMGEEGKVRAEGGFFDSSPVVFTHYKRELHVIPWGSLEIVNAINGKGPTELVQIFYKANIIRGADAGTAVPSAAVWAAILRTGELVYYRGWEKAGISISERVKAIVELSGNTLEEVGSIRRTEETEQEFSTYAQQLQKDIARANATGVYLKRYREREVREHIRATFMDYKEFKKDPNHPGENWMENYRRAGLRVEPSVHIGPEARCDLLNELLMPDPTRKHLNPVQGLVGSRVYVSKDCVKLIERFENYLHEQHQDGSFSGKPETEDDHTVDAACYAACAQMKWLDPDMIKNNRAMALSRIGQAQANAVGNSVTGYA